MTNDKDVLRVLTGYLALNPSQKMELRREIDDLVISGVLSSETTNTLKKAEVRMKFSSDLGPTNDNACKCCGKS
jgi:hypothetical protein